MGAVMNKLSKIQYIMLIADAMTDEYGGTLMEDGTDIKMAKAVLKKLKPYLFFSSELKADKVAYEKWEVERNLESGAWEFVYDDEGEETDRLTDGVSTWKCSAKF